MHILYLHTYICTYFSATFIFGYSLHSIAPGFILFRRIFLRILEVADFSSSDSDSWRHQRMIWVSSTHVVFSWTCASCPRMSSRSWVLKIRPITVIYESIWISIWGVHYEAKEFWLGFYFIIFLRVFSRALGWGPWWQPHWRPVGAIHKGVPWWISRVGNWNGEGSEWTCLSVILLKKSG